jgi:hypothetical protein
VLLGAVGSTFVKMTCLLLDVIKVWGSLGPSEAGTACTAAQEI